MKIYGFDDRCNICGENTSLIHLRKKITQTDLAARLQVRGVQLNQNGICRIEKASMSSATANSLSSLML